MERSTKWLTELPRVVLCGVLAVLWCADKFPCLSGDFSLLSVALRNCCGPGILQVPVRPPSGVTVPVIRKRKHRERAPV